MKKIALMTLVVMLAIFAFFYVQLNKLESAVSDKLAQYETVFQHFSIGFFPQPYVSFEGVKHNQISIEKLKGKFNFSALISGNLQLTQLDIQHIRFSDNALNSADIHLHFSDFNLDNFQQDRVQFNGPQSLTLEWDKPLYGDLQRFHFRFNKGEISRFAENDFAVVFEDAELNQQPLGTLRAEVDLSKYTKYVIADIISDCDFVCIAHLDYASYPDQSAVGFWGKNYPIERLLALFNFPNTLTGNTDFDITAEFVQSKIKAGKFYFSAHEGELSGVNLLALVGQYLPINWNEAELKQKDKIKTPYEKLVTSFTLNESQLKIDRITLKTSTLLGQGSGQVDLNAMQCDIHLNLRLANEKYADLSLPIHFFDNCYSPRYELQINKDFRKKIKELIKRKLK
nr:AsmA-like C-terminal region-containing protein [uncultured Aggregatibacter sp.]